VLAGHDNRLPQRAQPTSYTDSLTGDATVVVDAL